MASQKASHVKPQVNCPSENQPSENQPSENQPSENQSTCLGRFNYTDRTKGVSESTPKVRQSHKDLKAAATLPHIALAKQTLRQTLQLAGVSKQIEVMYQQWLSVGLVLPSAALVTPISKGQ